jgi:hypothetical protein
MKDTIRGISEYYRKHPQHVPDPSSSETRYSVRFTLDGLAPERAAIVPTTKGDLLTIRAADWHAVEASSGSSAASTMRKPI